MGKEVVEVSTKSEESEEAEEAEVEVELPEDKVTMELLLKKRYFVVL